MSKLVQYWLNSYAILSRLRSKVTDRQRYLIFASLARIITVYSCFRNSIELLLKPFYIRNFRYLQNTKFAEAIISWFTELQTIHSEFQPWTKAARSNKSELIKNVISSSKFKVSIYCNCLQTLNFKFGSCCWSQFYCFSWATWAFQSKDVNFQ